MQQPSRPPIMPITSEVQCVEPANGEGETSPTSGRIVGECDAGNSPAEKGGVESRIAQVGCLVQMDSRQAQPQVHFLHGGRRYGRQLALRTEQARKAQEKG